jgi:hypothetical protein
MKDRSVMQVLFWVGNEDRVKEGKYGGYILYQYMKIEE